MMVMQAEERGFKPTSNELPVWFLSLVCEWPQGKALLAHHKRLESSRSSLCPTTELS